MEQHFVLVLDDTGFNASDKKSTTLKNEQATFCCLVIPTPLVGEINKIFYDPQLGLCTNLKQRFGTAEFHFCEIYNQKNNFKNLEYEEMLDIIETFATLVAELDIDILTATQSNDTFANLPKFEEQFKKAINYIGLPVDKSHVHKSLALVRAIMSAKMHLEATYKNPIVDQIICDQGLLDEGKKLDFPLFDDKLTPLTFENSAKEPLLQIADFCAWSVTRTKNSYDGKTTLSESHQILLDKLSICAHNFVNLPKIEIDPDNLENYDTIISNLKNI